MCGCIFFIDTTKRLDVDYESDWASLIFGVRKCVSTCLVTIIFSKEWGFEWCKENAKTAESGKYGAIFTLLGGVCLGQIG